MRIAKQHVKKQGRKLDDLRFAKRTVHGYAFFDVGHDVWDHLHEIANEVFRANPQYDFAFVVEICSELVNTEEQDLPAIAP